MGRATRFRLICNALALVMLLVGVRQLVNPAMTLSDPLYSTAQLNCPPCMYQFDPVRLLDSPLQKGAWQTPGMEQRIVQRLQAPHVRWLIFAAEAVRAVPLFFLFLGLAVGIRSFAKAGFTRRSMLWLRVSAAAALLWSLAGPVSRSLRASAFDVLFTGVESFRLPIGFHDLIQGLLISGAALVAIWAIEEAMAIRRSLDDYV
jgi:hypothetical protein